MVTAGEPPRAIAGTYILCSHFPFFADAAARARARRFRSRELRTGGHDVMLTRPTELAALLLEVV